MPIPEPNAPAVSIASYDYLNKLVYADRLTYRKEGHFDLSTLPIVDYSLVVGPDQQQFTQLIQTQT